uniref:Ribonuclease H protein At1g65750 family n=2 Tax=Cajanus cajan TaxID=3821 RepID=A0A151TG86_CAJCA|nr:Putative ribonuclease H protein At1g65750 family [Cajanus cajan]
MSILLRSHVVHPKASDWWKDLALVCQQANAWLDNNFLRVVGDGGSVRFWHDRWVGGVILSETFPRLYSLAKKKQSTVGENGLFVEGGWQWEFQWRRRLILQREKEWENELAELVGGVELQSNIPDMWLWKCDPSKAFTVKSAYFWLHSFFSAGNVLETILKQSFRCIWKVKAPKKTIVFAWQLLLNSLPVRASLARRGIPVSNVFCALCNNEAENVCHLFLHCRISCKIWYLVLRWLGISACLPNALDELLLSMDGFACVKKQGRIFTTIWISVIWSLWLLRNRIIFNDGVLDIMEIVEAIKYRSWKWLSVDLKRDQLLYVNWLMDPISCIKCVS